MNNKKVGDIGEKIAKKHLESKGYIILDTNFRARSTEIDIICIKSDELIFVEVKTRNSKKFGEAAEAITEFKMKNIIDTSKYYIQMYDYYDYMVRYDVIEVYLKEKNINHIQNAFILT